MNRLDWIKELVKAEQQMEESGMIDIAAGGIRGLYSVRNPDKLR